MADADDSGRNPRSKGTANPTQLGMAQKRYREFDKKANTEYERLHAIDKKNKLTPNVNPTEHAFFVYLCALREAHLLKKAADDARSKSGGDKGDPLGTANPTQLGRAQKKYREFYKRANTKYERLTSGQPLQSARFIPRGPQPERHF